MKINHLQRRRVRSLGGMILILAMFVLGAFWLRGNQDILQSLAATFADDTQAEFNSGSYSDTQFDTDHVQLDATGLTNKTGTFTSQIFDAGGTQGWNNIAWAPTSPIGKELRDNAGSETVYSEGEVSMSDIEFMFHFNDSWNDNSGKGHSVSQFGGVGFTTDSLLGSHAVDFDGVDDYIAVNNVTIGTSPFTLSIWGKGGDYRFGARCLGGCTPRIYYDAGGLSYGSGDLADARIGVSLNTISGQWNHIVYQFTGSEIRIYSNGVLRGSKAEVAEDVPTSSFYFGRQVNSFYTSTDIDELALWKRSLSLSEIQDLYKHGSLSLQHQIRACDDDACSGETFVGPDGTTGTFFVDTEPGNNALPSLSISEANNGRYFQYQSTFGSLDSTFSPELSSVTLTTTSIVDDSEAEFDLGTYSDTQFDTGNSWLELDAAGLTNETGTFTSKVFDPVN